MIFSSVYIPTVALQYIHCVFYKIGNVIHDLQLRAHVCKQRCSIFTVLFIRPGTSFMIFSSDHMLASKVAVCSLRFHYIITQRYVSTIYIRIIPGYLKDVMKMNESISFLRNWLLNPIRGFLSCGVCI